MKIITVRRLSQIFFFVLFLWFCLVTTLGEKWWQLRGWPVNWLIQLDPLVGIGTWMATHRLYQGLIWGVVTIVLTLVLGRVFCGWICPWGTLQHCVGYLGGRGLSARRKIQRNQPHPVQGLKYVLLIFLLAAAATDLLRFILQSAWNQPIWGGLGFLGGAGVILWLTTGRQVRPKWKTWAVACVIFALGVWIEGRFPGRNWLATSLQTGLLDPLPLMHRSFNLALLPLADNPLNLFSSAPRWYQGGGLIGVLFVGLVIIGLRIPRFYCRFLCPTGALLGLLSRWSLWRLGKREDRCQNCRQCEVYCEGACAPSGTLQTNECVVCLNCRDHCRPQLMRFSLQPSASGNQSHPDLGRRQVVTAAAAGLVVIPLARLGAMTGGRWSPKLIRPPGALDETRFLQRCLKCGQCMRLCPTQVIQPSLLEAGWEGLWTPVLNFRMGSSGCQPNCVACSQICPTAALRPLTPDERMGKNQYHFAGPVRIGTAFIDRGRCLPWAMDTPCIVCQENCPVSPKAIFTRAVFQPLREGRLRVLKSVDRSVVLDTAGFIPGQWAGGDHFIRWGDAPPTPIGGNTANSLILGPEAEDLALPAAGEFIDISIRLQQPFMDPRACIGCGICEHECPVQGLRAIRVSAENESRHHEHRLVLSLEEHHHKHYKIS